MMIMEAEAGENNPIVSYFVRVYRIPLIIGGLSTFLVALSIVLIVKTVQSTSPIEFGGLEGPGGIGGEEGTGAAILGRSAGIVVDIEGAVLKPGLVNLPNGSRVDDALKAAGGMTREADSEWFARTYNRAQPLVDGAKIYVPRKGESGGSTTSHNNSFATSGEPVSQNYDPLLRRDDTSQNGSVSQNGLNQESANELVNINTATQSELESLSGVGPVTAQKIISGRPYMSLEELVTKKAMGVSLFGKLKGQLTL